MKNDRKGFVGRCCLVVMLLMLGPRFVLLCAWLMSNWYDAFDSTLIALVGWLFLPWTCLAWMYIHFNNAGEISGGYLLLFIIAIITDLGASFSSGNSARGNDG